MATLAQLESQIQKLQRRADVMREKKAVEAIAQIHAMMQEYGLTTADLAKAGLGAGRKRGRPAGSKNSGAASNGASGSKLPPKYRDPVSGATWSGHARAPAWIKDAPDRSVYLIDGAGGSASAKGAAQKGTRRARAASASRAGAKRATQAASKKSAKRTGRAAAKKASRKNAQSAAA